jgi:hypothetical protein
MIEPPIIEQLKTKKLLNILTLTGALQFSSLSFLCMNAILNV